MEIGDVVIPVPPCVFHSACSVYPCAIVVHMSPFTFGLSSVSGDMTWLKTIKPEEVKALCPADPKLVKRLVANFQRQHMKTVKVRRANRFHSSRI